MKTASSQIKKDAQSIQAWAESKLGHLDISGYLDNITAYKKIKNIIESKVALTEPELSVVKKYYKSYSRAFNQFINKGLIKNNDESIIAKYLLWNYHIHDVSKIKVLEHAIKLGLIKKSEDESGRLSYYITGLKVKVKKTKSKHIVTGREIKQYEFPCSVAAIKISLTNEEYSKVKKHLAKSVKNMAVLDSHFEMYDVVDINPIRLTENCKTYILSEFQEQDIILKI